MEGDQYRLLRPLTEGAVALALAQLLDGFGTALTFGGALSLGPLPILVFAVRWGAGSGALLGAVYGLLGILLRWDWSVPWQILAVEDLLAAAMLGTAGLFRGRRHGVLCGAGLGAVLRAACRAIAGIRWRADAVPERFFNFTNLSPEVYYPLREALRTSLDLVIWLAVLVVLELPLRRFFTADDIPGRDDEAQ